MTRLSSIETLFSKTGKTWYPVTFPYLDTIGHNTQFLPQRNGISGIEIEAERDG